MNAVSRMKGCKVIENVGPKEVADLLSQNVVVGRFAGRMEFGARSLGNRSILAHPSKTEIVKMVIIVKKFSGCSLLNCVIRFLIR